MLDRREEYLYISETFGRRITRMKVAANGDLSDRETDRADGMDWALAVEDCVSGARHSSYRRSHETQSEWGALGQDVAPEDTSDAVENGSIIGVCVEGWFDPSELDGLSEVPVEKTQRPLPAESD